MLGLESDLRHEEADGSSPFTPTIF